MRMQMRRFHAADEQVQQEGRSTLNGLPLHGLLHFVKMHKTLRCTPPWLQGRREGRKADAGNLLVRFDRMGCGEPVRHPGRKRRHRGGGTLRLRSRACIL